MLVAGLSRDLVEAVWMPSLGAGVPPIIGGGGGGQPDMGQAGGKHPENLPRPSKRPGWKSLPN